LLLAALLLVNAPNNHLSLVLVSVVQGSAVNCNTSHYHEEVRYQGERRTKNQCQHICYALGQGHLSDKQIALFEPSHARWYSGI